MNPTEASSSPATRLSRDQVAAFLDEAFPDAARAQLGTVVSVEPNHLRMRLDPGPQMLRPGGIVSGPTLMALVDVAAYAVIAAHHGPEAMAVTSSLSIAFLRACRVEPVFADAHLLKLGRRMATVDVRLWQRDEERLIAQSTVGYALPSTRS
ncbi:PaaI family thioesterase [Sphingomonas sp. ABOLF]|uniref:PaaI family thioesterase n=1 Tax=Sphingomonas sp. ABOLF TaxID=1985879 RepID=UPI000F7E49C5|nr:PaaI family thioesterase [Sphingomonas sp. ABOLF]RSV11537.1 PaaI family thioesterase [Sphingomonas sp. ABOLF]